MDDDALDNIGRMARQGRSWVLHEHPHFGDASVLTAEQLVSMLSHIVLMNNMTHRIRRLGEEYDDATGDTTC